MQNPVTIPGTKWAAETEHWGEMAGETYHLLRFYDAVILSALDDDPFDIRTMTLRRRHQ